MRNATEDYMGLSAGTVRALKRLQMHELTASDVEKVAGLSYRQLNDWEERGLLPTWRKSPSGWRRFTAWDVMELAILSRLRKFTGIPLGRLSKLLSWMQGKELSREAEMNANTGLSFLAALSGDRDLDQENISRFADSMTGRDDDFTSLFDGEALELHNRLRSSQEVGRAKLAKGLVKAASGNLARLLHARGWAKNRADQTSSRLLMLAAQALYGVRLTTRTADEAVALLESTVVESDYYLATMVASSVVEGVFPLMEAVTKMGRGYRLFLVTDLEVCDFALETSLQMHSQIPSFRRPVIIMEVGDLINDVLEAAGVKRIPVTESVAADTTNEILQAEEAIASLGIVLEEAGFESVTIRRVNEQTRTIWKRRLSDDDEVAGALASGDEYQTVRVSKTRGKISSAIQEISAIDKLPLGHGRIPTLELREDDD